MNATTFAEAPRQMRGITAAAEKRLLVWIAHRLPARVHSDQLTTLALVAMAMGGAAYAAASSDPRALWLVNLCLIINWFGDSLDGTLARVRQRQRPRFGFYVDHVVDAAGVAMLVGGMALSGYLTPLVALGVVAAYFLVSIEIYLATYCVGTFHMSVGRVGGTELRLILMALNTATVLWHPAPALAWTGGHLRLLDPIGLVLIAGLIGAFAASAVRHTRVLYEAERLKP